MSKVDPWIQKHLQHAQAEAEKQQQHDQEMARLAQARERAKERVIADKLGHPNGGWWIG